MVNSFNKREQNLIHKNLTLITKRDKPILKRILNSDLYAKKIVNLVLIFSKKNKRLYLMDIMQRKKFNEEFKKSINFFF